MAETKKALKARGKSTSNIKPGMITTSSASASNNNNKPSTCKKRKNEQDSLPPAKRPKSGENETTPKLNPTANGVKPRITSQGNKRMSIPDDAFPEFCRRIGVHGTGERRKLINDFAEEHPTTSVRQVTIKLGEITQKEPPPCVDMTGRKVRAFMFYLRPKFYKFLPPDERPKDWEKYAAEDEIKWQKEKEEERLKKQAEKAKAKAEGLSGTDAESVNSDRVDTASNASPSLAGGEGGDETEDEGEVGEPAGKKLKMEA